MPAFELLKPKETRLFSFRAGDAIRERVGGEMASLMAAELSWTDVFVIWETSASGSLLVSEPHETHKKTNRTAERSHHE